MKRFPLLIFAILFVLLFSCNLIDPDNTDTDIILADSIPEWYPSHLEVSEVRQAEYVATLNDFKTTYGIENTHFSQNNLYGQLYRVYFDVSDRIKVCDFQEDETYNESYENGIAAFIEDWKRLVSIEPFDIDFSSIRQNYGTAEFYIKSTYDLPVYSFLGGFSTYIDDNGYLIQMSSSIRPQLPVPENPMITANRAKNMVIGYHWHYYGIGGNRINCIVRSSQISSVTLNVFIDSYSSDQNEILYRLVWCVSTGDLPVDFLIDAMTGEFITYIQNFRT